MKWVSFLVLFALPVAGCATAGPPAAPRKIIGQLTDEDLTELAFKWPKRMEAPSITGDLVVLQIPQQGDIGKDTRQYFLYKGKLDHRFWLMVSGGYTGQQHWRGPVPVESVLDR